MNTPNGFAASGPLIWTQPSALRRQYELKNGDEIFGRLTFQKSCGSLVSAAVASQSWTFKREGFLSPRVTVRAPNSDVNLAVFHPKWTGSGVLEFSDGRQIPWRNTSFWGNEWAFLQGENRPLICFKQHDGLFKISARLEVDPAGAALPDLPLLAALGWYLMLLTAQDASIVAVTVATSG
jgi:hypothetical protein